ncbi:MAG: LysE family transporter [Fibrobacter sp.]|nr:LysE family transporter [Fibrobacter sp.]
MNNTIKIIVNGLITGLFLQLAIGPVFFFVSNVTLQRTLFDGFAAVMAVTIVDYLYIILAIVGIGKAFENVKAKKIFGIVGSLVLIVFGIIIMKTAFDSGIPDTVNSTSNSLISSFMAAFFLTISNPLTIVFFTGVFTAKTVEFNYTKRNLNLFGFSVGLATVIFLGLSVILFSLLRETIPVIVLKILNFIVGFVLVCYGTTSIIKIHKQQSQLTKCLTNE